MTIITVTVVSRFVIIIYIKWLYSISKYTSPAVTKSPKMSSLPYNIFYGFLEHSRPMFSDQEPVTGSEVNLW